MTHDPPITTKDVTALVAAGQIMAAQYRIMADNAAAALERPDPAPIHDMRVAMNRLRAALALFRTVLADAEIESTGKLLRDVRAAFGPARDAQLWVDFLNGLLQEAGTADDSPLRQYALDETVELEQALAELESHLAHESFTQLCCQLTALIETDIPRLAEISSVRFVPFVAKHLKKRFCSVLEEPDDTKSMSSSEMHQVRKRCKRLRYWAEFAAPVLDEPITELMLRAKAVTSAFGYVHDADVQHEQLKRSGFAESRAVRDALRRTRKAACRDAEKAWSMLRKPAFTKVVQSALTRLQ